LKSTARATTSDRDRAPGNSSRNVTGIALYLQPVQDLTIEDRVSRTQFQFTLGSPNIDDLNIWVPKLIDKLNQRPELSDVAMTAIARPAGI
jgi:multidrug efflux pump